ncbi:uncharacterized protein LOC122671129 [Telopea speciosissima]|uniref:uncharacterized protein LOC122671129 n=1 Tax=Telopea speciosissima TaxID=54955 RepID=UPI001CC4E39A|nr:uncharacterized protein LOC122671129 [Telopea speciosissima]
MINGEKAREISSDVPSPDPLDEFLPCVGSKSDVLSDYSSCRESEFERYCSANSVMGTASLCSSLGTCNDLLDSDLGYTRSLGFGEDPVLENFSFGARFPKNSSDEGSFDYSSDGRVRTCREKGDVGISVSALESKVLPGLNKWSKSLPRQEENSSIGAICSENDVENLTTRTVNNLLPKDDCAEDNAEGSMLGGHKDRGLLPGSTEHYSSEEIITVQNDKDKFAICAVANEANVLQAGDNSLSYVASCGENLNKPGPNDVVQLHEPISASPVSVDGKEIGKFTEAGEETSTRSERSEDERSSVDYGTDDEQTIGLSDRINLCYYRKGKTDNENPLLLNSVVAFGSDDWDKFEQEAVESSLTVVPFDNTQELQQQHVETERNLLSSNFAVVNESNVLQSGENSTSYVPSCGENKPGPNDVFQLHESTSASGVSVDGTELGKLTEADKEISTRYERSEDERSSVDYGTDDEQRIGLSDRINLPFYHKGKTDDENPLLINTSVAFGSDDWDKFEQEAVESSLTAVPLDDTQEPQRQHVETERNLLISNFVVENESNVLQSGEISPSDVASCIENFNEPIPCDVVQLHESTSASGVSVDGMEVGKFTEVDKETSTRYEHSEDERSSVDYGTDDEQRIGLSDRINLPFYHKSKTDDENPLLINTSVAFGTDDWDKFEQEAVESSLMAVPLDETQEPQRQHVETERNLLSSNFAVVNESNVLQSGEISPSDVSPHSPSDVPSCGENFNEPCPNDVIQLHGLTSVSGFSVDGMEVGKFTETHKETSTRYEHSEDERSLVDYGTDDEQSIGLSDRINVDFYHKGKIDDENSLLINSAVAFGSDDWDKFEQEAKESSLTAVLLDEIQEPQQQHVETERNLLSSTLGAYSGSPIFGVSEQVENMEEIPISSCRVQATNKSTEYLERYSVSNVLTLRDLSVQKAPGGIDSNIMDDTAETELQYINDNEMSSLDKSEVVKVDLLGSLGILETQLQLDPLSNAAVGQLCSIATETCQDNVTVDLQNVVKDALPPMVENDEESLLMTIVTDSSVSKDLGKENVASNEAENLELNEFYDEVVHEMEEILLDSVESPGARFTKGNRASLSQHPNPFRDGSSTASTSGTDDAYPQVQQPLKIDGIEVVGAKQKKGEVSLGERLVGVKEYTVYRLRVWSGEDQWEVERRYRDFVSLYRQLKTFFADKGQVLPSPWFDVERESRKIFGNASPDVVTQRSALIQDCLRSIRHFGFLFSASSPLIWFLSPQRTLSNSSMLNTFVPHSPSAYGGETSTQGVSTLGKTISLLVEVPPHKSMKELLESQHYSCAGCHRYFNEGKTLLKEFVETFGWGKPRLCEYTAQLFCASCHTNDTAILPAKVLHFWDFTQYPVSQLAKSYLESIYDQPMLCVSAVNPFLVSRVPTLHHVMGIRKKVGAMLPYVHCPFRRSIYRGLGSRRYLVESNDFFALRDLVDLSRGAFAALPVMVENVSKKISEHITDQCLICCDVGVPCGARQACEDPSSLIFPFQAIEVERCRSCESVFHEACFRKLRSCPCGTNLEVEHHEGPTDTVRCNAGDEVDGALDLSARKSNTGSTMSFLTGLFSRVGSEKTLSPRDNSTVILMGSLPSNSL